MQESYEYLNLRRHLDEQDAHYILDSWRDHLSMGVKCPRCLSTYFPYYPSEKFCDLDAIKRRARQGYRENIKERTIQWFCPECTEMVEVEV